MKLNPNYYSGMIVTLIELIKGEIGRDVRAIGFGEDGDSVGVDNVLNECGNRIRGFHLRRSIPCVNRNQRNG